MATTIPDAIRRQVNAASALIRQVFEENLVAIHLYGSAVESGLKPQSDIDLLVTIREPMDARLRETVMRELLTISAPPGTSERYRALEVTVVLFSQIVPWRFPPVREMQFGEWLRDDIGAGVFEPALADPDLAILLTGPGAPAYRYSVNPLIYYSTPFLPMMYWKRFDIPLNCGKNRQI